MKVSIQNSLKSIILRNLSEDRIVSGLQKKDSIKKNPYSEDKKIMNGLNRPFSQNTNFNYMKIERMLETEEKELVNPKDYKENESNRPVRRRINFNSFNNNYFPKSIQNANTENLNLNDAEENELTIESNHRERKYYEKRKHIHQSGNNLYNHFQPESCQAGEFEEIHLLSNN